MHKPFTEKRKDWAAMNGISTRYVASSLHRGYSFLGSGTPVNHPLKTTYEGMLQRCYNPNCPSYRFYGEKGIRVCARWFYSFDQFATDMGPRPLGHTLDRIDIDKNYSPENCRWACSKTQAKNRCNTISEDIKERVKKDREINGLSYGKLSEKYGISRSSAHAICSNPNEPAPC